jgi:hypothetical protein
MDLIFLFYFMSDIYIKNLDGYKGFGGHGNRLKDGLKDGLETQSDFIGKFINLFIKTEKFRVIPKNIRLVLEKTLKSNLKNFNTNVNKAIIKDIYQKYKKNSVLYTDKNGIDFEINDFKLVGEFSAVLALQTKLIADFDNLIPDLSEAINFNVSSIEAKKIVDIVSKIRSIIYSDEAIKNLSFLEEARVKLVSDKNYSNDIDEFSSIIKQLITRFQTCLDVASIFAGEVEKQQTLNLSNNKKVKSFACAINPPLEKKGFVSVILTKIIEVFSKIVDVFKDIFPSKDVSKSPHLNSTPSVSTSMENISQNQNIFYPNIIIERLKKHKYESTKGRG